jgi:predicted nuclease of predicted toxin-antitoxin system
VRFKLDENVDVRAEAPLSAAGHDVATVVGQDLGGAVDTVVADAVRAEGRILVTFDRGFADLRAYPPGSHPGMVVLRLRRQGLASVTAALELLAGYEGLAGIGGCTVIVSDASVRVRRASLER